MFAGASGSGGGVNGRMINVPREAGVMCDGKQERFV